MSKVLSLSINEEGSLFSACTDSAVTIYNMEPLVAKLHIQSSQIGTVALCKLLHRTNLIALVAGGSRPKYADNAVLIWDDHLKQFVLEFTFASRVLSLRTRRDRLFVVERSRIHGFTFPNSPAKLFTIETGDNPLGICEVTPHSSATELQLLAYPGHRVGSVQLLDLWMSGLPTASPSPSSSSSTAANTTTTNTVETVETEKSFAGANGKPTTAASVSISPTSVSAHQSAVACIALNRSGSLLATASQKGTLIRIFRTTSDSSAGGGGGGGGHSAGVASRGSSSSSAAAAYTPLSPEKVAEFRRGLDTVTLYGLVFSPDSEYLLASSDKGTVHLFSLASSDWKLGGGGGGRRSALAPLVNINGEYSLSKFTLPAECACVCAFGADHRRSIYAICVDGTFHKYRLGKDGTCERDNFDNYLEANEESEQMLL